MLLSCFLNFETIYTRVSSWFCTISPSFKITPFLFKIHTDYLIWTIYEGSLRWIYTSIKYNITRAGKLNLDQLLLSGPKEGPMCHKHANKNRQEKVSYFYTLLVGLKVLDFHVGVMNCEGVVNMTDDCLIALFKTITLYLVYKKKRSIAKKCTVLCFTFLATTMYVKVKSFERKYITLLFFSP